MEPSESVEPEASRVTLSPGLMVSDEAVITAVGALFEVSSSAGVPVPILVPSTHTSPTELSTKFPLLELLYQLFPQSLNRNSSPEISAPKLSVSV